MISSLVEAVAEFLAGATEFVYKTSTPYAPTDKAIIVGDLPADPDTVIALNVYDPSTIDTYSLENETAVIPIQFRLRLPTKTDGWALYEELHSLLHRKRILLNGQYFTVREQSFMPLGVDGNGREEFTHNFIFTGSRARTVK